MVAERGRCRSLDVVTDKQASPLNQINLELHVGLKNPSEETTKERTEPWTPSNLDQIIEVVNKQKSPVLYYSLAAGRLYAWLLQPHKGRKKIFLNNINIKQSILTITFYSRYSKIPPSISHRRS